MKHIHTYEEFLNESGGYIDDKHKKFVQKQGLSGVPISPDLNDVYGKTAKTKSTIDYGKGGGRPVPKGTEGTIMHAWKYNDETVYVVSGKSGVFEVKPDEVEIL